MRRAVAMIVIAAPLAACGDNGGNRPDAPRAIDATGLADAAACVSGEVETSLVSVGVNDGVHTVVLDGNGTRCEQLTRAVFDPPVFPAELAPMLDVDFRTQCTQFSQFDDVELVGDGIGGVPFVGGFQWDVFVEL